MNVDGAFSFDGNGGCGGIIRKEKGEFMGAFLANIPVQSSFEAEKWTMFHGLKLAWDKGIRRLIVESDALEVVNVLLSPISSTRHMEDIDRELISMIGREWSVQVVHVARNANRAADVLAKQGLQATRGYHGVETLFENFFNVLYYDSRYLTDAG